MIQERRQLRFSLSQAEAEVANVARIRQVRDAVTAQVGRLEIELARVHKDRDRAIQQRDETVSESQSRLLAQIADMQRAYQLVRRDRDQLQDRYDGLQKEHQDLSADRDSAIRERASALDRLTSLASAALREASTARRGRSVSSTRRSIKRSLSPSPASRPSDSGRSRKILRSSSSLSCAEGGDRRSGLSEIGSDAGSVDPSPAPAQQSQLQCSPARSAAASVRSVGDHDLTKPAASGGSDAAFGDSDASSGESDDDQVRVALARSRADIRRRQSSDPAPSSCGSATAPIELDPEAVEDETGGDPEAIEGEAGEDPEAVEGEAGEDSGEAEVEDLTASTWN
jgi:hypothetical protein